MCRKRRQKPGQRGRTDRERASHENALYFWDRPAVCGELVYWLGGAGNSLRPVRLSRYRGRAGPLARRVGRRREEMFGQVALHQMRHRLRTVLGGRRRIVVEAVPRMDQRLLRLLVRKQRLSHPSLDLVGHVRLAVAGHRILRMVLLLLRRAGL